MKNFLYSALIILIGLFSIQLLLPQIANATQIKQGWLAGQKIVDTNKTGLTKTPLKEVVFNVLKFLLSLIFGLTIIAFVGSGIIFIMSFGNTSLTGMAKDWLMYAIIGLIVSVLGFVIIVSISQILIKDTSSNYTPGATQQTPIPFL